MTRCNTWRLVTHSDATHNVMLLSLAVIATSCLITGCGSDSAETRIEKPTESVVNDPTSIVDDSSPAADLLAGQEMSPLEKPAATSPAVKSPVESGPVVTSPVVTSPESDSKFDRAAELARGDALASKGEFREALGPFEKMVLADSGDVEALFRLANVHAALGDLETAVEVIGGIPTDHPQAGLPALGQSADWYFRLKRYAEAERNFSLVLKAAPQADVARRQLAFLLNRQGRRHEAAQHIRQLCLRGNVLQDELHSLALLGDAIYDDPNQITKANTRRYTPIGSSGAARKLYMDAEYMEAAKILEKEVEAGTAKPAVVAFYGRCVAESQDDKKLAWWLSKTDDATQQYAEYWSAIGAHLILERQYEQAVRALMEAVDRDPTDLRSIARLQTTLESIGKSEQAKLWNNRWKQVRDLIRANNRVTETSPPRPDAVAELSRQLRLANRNIESLMWKSLEAALRGLPREQFAALNQQRQELIRAKKGFPSQADRLCGMQLDDFAWPKSMDERLAGLRISPSVSGGKLNVAKFHNVAAEVGLTHRYEIASKQQVDGFAIYQVAGGGVAALDYDRDGHVDLAFAQGGSDSPEYQSTMSNELYRNIDLQMQNVTQTTGATETRYTIGITAGDWNQDGFPDLVYGNIGSCTLLINQGDGTFMRGDFGEQSDKTLVPLSLAMADVSGDQLPDLVKVNYVHDAKLGKLPQRNETGQVLRAVPPTDYRLGIDQVFTSDGSGGAELQRISDTGLAGMGVVVTDLDGKPGNDIFVGNDLGPNNLWRRNTDTNSWQDVATAVGCAYGFSGAATASMGIASGDFDSNGFMDLQVTNYQQENVCLYLNNEHAFQDRNRQFRLAKPSEDVLGFGTQGIDYDNDSRLDLVVVNGHVENSANITGAFQQKAQMFANQGSRFGLVDVMDESAYWSKPHAGRALARLDFDRDGRNDFVVTHLNERSALMLNRSERSNHWLQLRLVGKTSERDAIGARVRVQLAAKGDERWHSAWVVAGDGYLARNEPIVSFGLGSAVKVQRIEVRWSDGSESKFENVSVDQRLLIVQGQGKPFALIPNDKDET